MAIIRNCAIPEELYYLVDKHVWARPDAAGLITVGVTDVAQHLAGKVVAVTPKKPGRPVQKGQSVATVESSKWVGPVPSPVGGEIVEANDAVRQNPPLLNHDPYEAGWIVRIRPGNWEGDRAGLVTGPDGVEAYRQLLEAQNLECGKSAQ
jgi:glycine cleavage system H protein